MAKRRKKKARKGPPTPRSTIESALRRYIWLRCRERAEALRRAGYRCQGCGVKQSAARGQEVRLDVHHKNPADMKKAVDAVFEFVITSVDNLVPLCRGCHDAAHDKGQVEGGE